MNVEKMFSIAGVFLLIYIMEFAKYIYLKPEEAQREEEKCVWGRVGNPGVVEIKFIDSLPWACPEET